MHFCTNVPVPLGDTIGRRKRSHCRFLTFGWWGNSESHKLFEEKKKDNYFEAGPLFLKISIAWRLTCSIMLLLKGVTFNINIIIQYYYWLGLATGHFALTHFRPAARAITQVVQPLIVPQQRLGSKLQEIPAVGTPRCRISPKYRFILEIQLDYLRTKNGKSIKMSRLFYAFFWYLFYMYCPLLCCKF